MIVIAAALLLAGSDTELRQNFVACLKTASVKAGSQKIGADAFIDFARAACATAEEPFKATLVNANVQHGMSRKESASDANSQITDYYTEWKDKYADDLPPVKQAAAPAPAPVTPPAPTPASEPK
jgi:hypothetical protein